jgi:hypothetical protein
MARLLGTRALMVMALARLWAEGVGVAQAANCTEDESSSIPAAFSTFQDSVIADCTVGNCTQVCVDTQWLMSTALPDCVYVDGTNYHQQVLDFIAACDLSATVAPTDSPVASPTPVVETASPEPTATPVALVTPSETPAATTSAPTTTAAPTPTTDGSQTSAATCTSEQGDSILAAYGTYQSNISLACVDDKCASTCVLTQTEVLALLPDCLYADGTNYHSQVSDALEACGVATSDDAGFVASTLPCSSTQSNVTIILYSQYEGELREACDADKCSTDCVSIVNQLASVLPNCVYSDGINYYNESSGIIDECGNASAVGSGSVGSASAASSLVRSLTPLLLGLVAALAVAL